MWWTRFDFRNTTFLFVWLSHTLHAYHCVELHRPFGQPPPRFPAPAATPCRQLCLCCKYNFTTLPLSDSTPPPRPRFHSVSVISSVCPSFGWVSQPTHYPQRHRAPESPRLPRCLFLCPSSTVAAFCLSLFLPHLTFY